VARKNARAPSSTEDLRRVPSQERSRRRLEAIVEAAAASFARDGFAATTMERIAADAGTSIGSVYQFFPNKRAVFKAVALECIRLSEQAFSRQLTADAVTRPWHEVVDATVDVFVALAGGNPVFRAVWRNLQLHEDYAAEDEAQLRDFVERSASLLGFWLPEMSVARRRHVAAVLIQSTMGLLFVAGRGDGSVERGLVREAKLMLRRYLAPYVESKGRSP
jgi:AcrR family transcriptional regulator